VIAHFIFFLVINDLRARSHLDGKTESEKAAANQNLRW